MASRRFTDINSGDPPQATCTHSAVMGLLMVGGLLSNLGAENPPGEERGFEVGIENQTEKRKQLSSGLFLATRWAESLERSSSLVFLPPLPPHQDPMFSWLGKSLGF